MDKDKDKQSIRADEYEEKVQYAPGWPPQPQPEASIDPQLKTDLSEIKEHPPTQQEYMPQIVDQLKKCYDPEISVDIYNLGLIYDVKVTEEGWVHVLMSLTSAFCPAADQIVADIKGAAETVEGVDAVEVITTFDPPFGPWNMSDEAKMILGVFE